MDDGKLYIIVTDQLPGGSPDPGTQPDKKEKKEKDSTLEDFATHQFFNLIENQAKQAVSSTLGNIGNLTGDYVAQQQVNNAMGFVNIIEKLGIAAIAGSKFGAPGSLIAVSVVAISETISAGWNEVQGYLQNKKQNYAIAQLRKRAGMNGTNNESRGTLY